MKTYGPEKKHYQPDLTFKDGKNTIHVDFKTSFESSNVAERVANVEYLLKDAADRGLFGASPNPLDIQTVLRLQSQSQVPSTPGFVKKFLRVVLSETENEVFWVDAHDRYEKIFEKKGEATAQRAYRSFVITGVVTQIWRRIVEVSSVINAICKLDALWNIFRSL